LGLGLNHWALLTELLGKTGLAKTDADIAAIAHRTRGALGKHNTGFDGAKFRALPA
jgi:hypothetical protein